MSEQSKKARADMKAKAKRMAAGESGAKVDASSWSPPEGLNADKQTGLRPVSPRQFKRGGKLSGKAAAVRADRKPRKSGGATVADKINRDVKAANAEKFGKPHVGGMKDGGKPKRPGKFWGGALGGGRPMGGPRPPMPMPPQGAPPPQAGGAGMQGPMGGQFQLPPQLQAAMANRMAQMQAQPGAGMPPPGSGMFGGQLPPAVIERLGQLRGMAPQFGGAPAASPVAPPAPAPAVAPTSPPPPFKSGGGVNSKNGSNYLGGTRPTGGRIARATGGKSGGKGKTNIIIAVNPGGSMGGDPMQQAPRQQMPVAVQPPPPPPPQGVPMQMPAGPPQAAAPPPAQMMPRKTGGRVKKTASSYKDMTAGSLGGIGRMQKTSIEEKKGSRLA